MNLSWKIHKGLRGLAAAIILTSWLSCSTGPSVNPGPSAPGVRQEPLTLTYIANMGAMVSAGDSKVLIDALFDKPNPEYRAPAPEVLDEIMKGSAPFDGIDLLLVTHSHPDHFDAALAARYLAAFPEAVLLAPADAAAEMQKAADWDKIAPRIISLDIKVGEKETRDLKGVSVTAFRTLHSGGGESPMNIMYLFDVGGWSVFHEGDSDGKPEVYQGFGLSSASVNMAIVHYWFPLEPNCARFLQEVFTPDHIALTHLPIRLESDAPGKIDQVRQYYKDLFLLLPGMPAKVLASPIDRPDLRGGKSAMDKILKLEDSAMEEWRKGNPMRWAEISADEVIYIDPGLSAPIVGKAAYIQYLETLKGKIFYDQSEYVKPQVALYGKTAILTYNYHSLSKDQKGQLQRTSFWNTTEVYRLIEGEWKIVHTHWSYLQHHLPESLEVKIPVLVKRGESLRGIAAEIMRLETGAMERWRKGDPSGFLEISAPEVTYFDTGTPARLNGYAELKKEYDKRVGKIHYDVMEFINPRFQVFEDSAVLFYQFFSTTLNPDGTIKSRTPWNCTEVYVRTAVGWKIVHTHWSYINGQREDSGV